ncbi:carbon-nitrogen hydrolase family protein, partial [Candidatus Latescibacterota bacterium]
MKKDETRRLFLKSAILSTTGASISGAFPAHAKYLGTPSTHDLVLAVLQIDSNRPTVEGNLEKLSDRITQTARKGANVMVAGELQLYLGAYDDAERKRSIQSIPGPATEVVGAASRKANCYALFGLVEQDGDNRYNALAITGPKGNLVAKYRKVHLFQSENKRYQKGESLCIFNTEFGKIAATICYDIMYPEFFRALAERGVGVIAHSTAMNSDEKTDTFGWSAGMYHSLVRTRAFENQVYIPSSDICGTKNGRYFFAHSCIVSPWGEFLGKLGDAEGTLVKKTDFERLKEWQKIAPYWLDRRPEFYGKVLDFE